MHEKDSPDRLSQNWDRLAAALDKTKLGAAGAQQADDKAAEVDEPKPGIAKVRRRRNDDWEAELRSLSAPRPNEPAMGKPFIAAEPPPASRKRRLTDAGTTAHQPARPTGIPAFLRAPEALEQRTASQRLNLRRVSGPALLVFTGIAVAGTTVTGASYLQDVDLVRVLTGKSDAPELDVLDVRGVEDEAIQLAIRVYPAEETALEAVTLVGLPEGFALSPGTRSEDGTWQLPADQLERLSLVAPENYHGSMTLTVEATARKGTEQAKSVEDFRVRVNPVADVPGLRVVPADGLEDEAVPLTLTAAPSDPQETVTVMVRGLPDGATLTRGSSEDDGSWRLATEELDDLAIVLPAHFKGDFSIQVDAIAQDGDDTVLVSRPLPIRVSPVADQPNLSVDAATGTEDQPVPLEILVATADPDEAVSVEVAGLPPGARLSVGEQGSDGQWRVDPGSARGISLLPPPNFSGPIELSVTATTKDGRDQSSMTKSARIDIAAAADTPTLTVQDAAGSEDTRVALSIAAVASDASEDVQVKVGGLPEGVALSAGSASEDGQWTLPADQLTGLSLQPPAHFSGAFELTVEAVSTDGNDTASASRAMAVSIAPEADGVTLGGLNADGREDEPIAIGLTAAGVDPSETVSVLVMDMPAGASFSGGRDNGNGTWTLDPTDLAELVFTPPPEINGTIRMPVVATAIDGSDRATATGELAVIVAPVADPVRLSVADSTGIEDRPVPLQIQIEAPDNQTAWLVLTGLPNGASLSAGAASAEGWRLDPGDLAGLELQPPPNFSGEMNVEAVAVSADGTDQAEQRQGLQVAIEPVADDPILSVAATNGTEDQPIPLDVTIESTDASEVISLGIAGVPEGGVLSGGTRQSDGSWLAAADSLGTIQLQPPAQFSGTIALELTATSTDGRSTASVTQPLQVEVTPVADAPQLAAEAAVGTEDQPVPVSVTMSSPDPSETVRLLVTGLPAGAGFTAGRSESDGGWSLGPDDLGDLSFVPSPNASGAVELDLAAVSIDGDDRAVAEATLAISLAPVAEVPTIQVADASGIEDEPVALQLTAESSDPDELVSLLVSGLPEGSRLNRGTQRDETSWTLHAPDDLSGLELSLAPDDSGTFQLEVVAVSTDGETRAESTAGLAVSVAAVADPAVLSVAPASGTEDQPFALPIGVEKSPREDLIVSVDGLPPEATLSAGDQQANGSWILPPDQLDQVALVPPANYSGAFDLRVTATTTDGSDAATVTASLPITVAPVADQPKLSLDPAAGDEDNAIPLKILAAAQDPSERLSLHVWGLPPESFLTAGRSLGGSRWLLDPRRTDDLHFIPPHNFSGALQLRIEAESIDGTQVASAWGYLDITVNPVADEPLVVVAAATGEEDAPVPLVIQALNADPSEELTVLVTDLPDGATLTRGETVGQGVVALTAEDLADVSLLAPPHFSGTLELAVAASTNDQGQNASAVAPLQVSIEPVADRPALTVRDAIGIEDGIIALDIEAGTPDPSEQLVLRLAGLPAGSEVTPGALVDDGTWEISGGLSNLSLIPPANFSGQFDVQVTATTVDGEATAATDAAMTIGIVPVADRPEVVAEDVTGVAGQPLPLAIAARAPDPRETIAFTLSGLPDDFALSAGQRTTGGAWQLQLADLEGLAILPPADRLGTLEAAIRGIATDGSDRAIVEQTFSITVVAPIVEQVAQPAGGLVPPAHAAVPPNNGFAATDDQVSDQTAVQPAALAPTPEAPAPAPPTVREDDPQTLKLVARADQLLELGDLAAARLLYQAAADAGSVDAALHVGRTYDPIFLEVSGLFGARPDPGKALGWYETAREGRHADAAKFITRLREWMEREGVAPIATQ